jgi:hypothetical protein
VYSEKFRDHSRFSVAERMVSDSESSSVGKESQFETLYEQDFQALRQECLNTGTLFEDLEFLPREEFLRHLICNNPKRMARSTPLRKIEENALVTVVREKNSQNSIFLAERVTFSVRSVSI